MNKKKTNSVAPKAVVQKAFDTTKGMASKANNFALFATEEIVSESIEVASQWQNVSETMINDQRKFKVSIKATRYFF